MNVTIGITKSMSNTKNKALAKPWLFRNNLHYSAAFEEMQREAPNARTLKNMRTAKQLLETYLAAISAGETEKAIALFADDGGIEFPHFGSVKLPTRYQGPEALRGFFAPVVDGAENFKFKNIKIFPGEDENHVSGEYEVDAVIKNTGRRYGSFTVAGLLRKTDK